MITAELVMIANKAINFQYRTICVIGECYGSYILHYLTIYWPD